MMPKQIDYRFLLAIIFVVILCAGVAASVASKNGSPDVKVLGDGAVYDAGDIQPPGPADHVYTLFNPHPYTIEAFVESVGCECTHAGISSTAIRPFGKATVRVTVDLEDSINISSGVCIQTAHAGQKVETWLMMTGKVIRPVQTAKKHDENKHD